MKKFFIFCLLICMFISICCCIYIQSFLKTSVNIKDKIIYIEKGKSLSYIANLLEKEKIISNKYVFKGIILFKTKNKPNLKYGEYLFLQDITNSDAIDVLLNNKSYIRSITFAEGLTNYSIAKLLNENNYLSGDLIDYRDIQEGSLLAETYSFQRGDTRQSIIQRMQKALNKVLDEEWEKRDSNLPYKNKYEALIMASIIEKETGIDSERKLVASVFVNRLKIGMALQTDPSSLYGYTKGDTTKEKDKRVYLLLREKSPYNTYKNRGLPPTPICNTGISSIRAVLHPENTKYIYFVATGNGGHRFSTTYKEHLANVKKFRKTKEEQRKMNKNS